MISIPRPGPELWPRPQLQRYWEGLEFSADPYGIRVVEACFSRGIRAALLCLFRSDRSGRIHPISIRAWPEEIAFRSRYREGGAAPGPCRPRHGRSTRGGRAGKRMKEVGNVREGPPGCSSHLPLNRRRHSARTRAPDCPSEMPLGPEGHCRRHAAGE